MPTFVSAMRVFSVLALLLFAATAQAQVLNPVTWQAEVAPKPVPAGEQVRLVLQAQIEAGWNMYAMDTPRGTGKPLVVELSDENPAIFSLAGGIRQNEPIEKYDPNFQKDSRFFSERARVEVTFDVAEDAAPGEYTLEGRVQYMVCNDRQCLPPKWVPVAAAVVVEAAQARSGGEPPPELSPVEEAPAMVEPELPVEDVPVEEDEQAQVPVSAGGSRAGGLWAFLVLAVGAGLAALLTPCVFPMIPLTVSYFTHHAHDRGQAVKMAGAYGLAIVLTFTLLGVLAGIFIGAAGAQTIAANPWVNLFIGVVFIIFALSLLGLFELRLPNAWLNFANKQSHEQKGYLGVIFMGLTLTLVSFSCTVPFVAALLAAAAQSEWTRPIIGMLAFSATFALPFVLFALFPRALTSLPKSGAWMSTVKVVLGFVELAAALKFLSNADLVWGTGLLSRTLAVALCIVIFFCCGLYLLGKLRLAHEEPIEAVGTMRLVVAIGFLGLSFYLMPGLFGAPLGGLDAYLPPRQATDVSLVAVLQQQRGQEGGEAFRWIEDREAAFAEARTTGKPVFIDFTGYTCTNCRFMEANVFPRPGVADRLEEEFVLLRLWTDNERNGPELQRYQLQLTGSNALPTYAIVTPEGKLVTQWGGIARVTEFAAFLETGIETYRRQSLAVR